MAHETCDQVFLRRTMILKTWRYISRLLTYLLTYLRVGRLKSGSGVKIVQSLCPRRPACLLNLTLTILSTSRRTSLLFLSNVTCIHNASVSNRRRHIGKTVNFSYCTSPTLNVYDESDFVGISTRINARELQ